MESKFIPTLQSGNGYTYLKLKGILDEDNLLSDLLTQIQGRLLLIDMAEIERINSCGVRDWVNWLNQIQALGITVMLLRCSPVVVSQANMVTNFAADAFIHSFYAPYVHPDTGDEQSVLLFTEEVRKTKPIRAPKIENENGEELEFDEFEESYFAFINDPRMMQYQIPADIQTVIEYFLPEATSRKPVVSAKVRSGVVSGSAATLSATPSAPRVGLNSGLNSGFGNNLRSASRPSVPASPTASSFVPPKVSSQQIRHEQPPLPPTSGYLKAPSALSSTSSGNLPSAPLPSGGVQGLSSSGSSLVAGPATPVTAGPASSVPSLQAVGPASTQMQTMSSPSTQSAENVNNVQGNAAQLDALAKQRKILIAVGVIVIVLLVALIVVIFATKS